MKRFAIALLLLAACSNEEPATATTATPAPAAPPPPTVAQARDLIAGSPEFGDYEFTDASFSLPVSGAAMNDPARVTARALAAAGWITVDGAGDIMLTDKSRDDKRFLLRPNGILDIVPLAKKEMGDVRAVRLNPDNTASADFTWQWRANEVGALLSDRFAGVREARAQLILDGTKWSVLKIEPRSAT